MIVDHDISPSQARNLERATGAEVLDRTGVIVEIFHRHAHSREAKLQVEMARLKYVSPRLRESSGGGRQQGVGAGESDLELDRRKIRDRLAELKQQLEDVERDNDQRRSARRDQLRVALVGYTNAGKSSLMRVLTGSEALVEDKLFATLDTTVRALQPDTRPRVLVSDTVGFIKKLPHDLVASFRSTLAEALEASLLLFVVDASDPTYQSQLEVSREVLREIGAQAVPSRLLLNKIDRVSEADRAALREKHPDAILLSAKSPADVAALRETIISFFEASMVEDEAGVAVCEAGDAQRRLRECARALGGLRRHRPDYEGAGPPRRDRAPAQNPRCYLNEAVEAAKRFPCVVPTSPAASVHRPSVNPSARLSCSMRLKSSIWVAAYLRRCQTEGIFGAVRRRGAEEAGAVFVKVALLDGNAMLYAPAPQTVYDDSRPIERLFAATSPQPVPEASAEERLAKEIRFDPDVWIVETEDRAGRHFLDLAKA